MGVFVNLSVVFDNHEQLQGHLAILELLCLGFVEAPASVACVLAMCLRSAILAETSANVRLVQPQWLIVFLCPVVMMLISNSLQEERQLSGL